MIRTSLITLLFVAGCATPAASVRAPIAEIDLSAKFDDGSVSPESVGIDSRGLLKVTDWIGKTDMPIYSLLISRNGRLIYELYTSGLHRDDAHYLMSVTKSVVSLLVGIAIDRKILSGPEETVTQALPRNWFAGDEDYARFSSLTLHDVMGMDALDAPDPPRDNSDEGRARHARFWNAENRARYATTLPLLARGAFQYNDTSPSLVAGMLQSAAKRSLLELGDEALFGPLGFSNHEWMHQDKEGIDLGGYGFRARPIDLQKLGLLMLNHGAWKGRQIVSRAWVERSFEPWNRTSAKQIVPNYGWYWWTMRFGDGWTALVANGWKGQRIAIFPAQQVVVTMTGCFDDDDANAMLGALAKKILAPGLRTASEPHDSVAAELAARIEAVRTGPSRIAPGLEDRMVPSSEHKETHRPFVGEAVKP